MEKGDRVIDRDVLPKECPECKRPTPPEEWIQAIGNVGAFAKTLDDKVIFICECGHKMYSGILQVVERPMP